jgi:hypothetical protein
MLHVSGLGRKLPCIALLGGVLALAEPARAADPSEGGAAAAESLFQDGRRLVDQKKYSEACPKFLASQKLAPALGTLLNLADCYEKAGQLASAWVRFREAVALAQRLGRSDREATAHERASKLEPRLIRLKITSLQTNADVKLDGNALDPAVLGTLLPIDPGKHTVEAAAKGKKPFHTTIDVSERVKSPAIEIPALEDEPQQKAETPPPPSPPSKPPKETVEDDKGNGRMPTQKILGLVSAGVGVVGLGVGSFFGLRTSSLWNDALAHCNQNAECDREGVQLAADAKSAGNISTIAFIAGGAFLVGGAVLFFTAPTGERRGVGIGPGSVYVGGTF